MIAKTTIYGSVAVILCSVSFWVGRVSQPPDVITYPVNQLRVSFHTDWPTYGLPIAEYKTILTALRSGRTSNAIDKAEGYLDVAIYDAKRRWPLLNGRMRGELDKALRAAAQYRRQHPRQKPTPVVENTVPSLAEWSVQVEKNSVRREEEIDSFLRDF